MEDKPRIVYLLVVLWLLWSIIFFAWVYYSLDITLSIPSWEKTEFIKMYPILFFTHLLSSVAWLVFVSLLFVLAYGTLKAKSWAWTAGLIVSTIFIVILGLMLISFMITAILFKDFLSVMGLETVIISFLIDLSIVYCITRPKTKAYFGVS